MAVESHPPTSMSPPNPGTPIRPTSTTTLKDLRRTPEATTARARRSLAASRAARSGISSVVESLRVAKPPRVPYKPATQPSAATVARRHALIPLAEGRDKLEARIRSLEDSLGTRDEAFVKLKRQLGRALIKRRHVERERDSAVSRLSAATTVAHNYHALAASTRADFQAFIDSIVAIFQSIIISNTGSSTETNDVLQIAADFLLKLQVSKEATSQCLRSIIEAVRATTDKLQTPLPPCTIETLTSLPVASSSMRSRPLANAAQHAVSTAPSDEDTRSCGSFTSSALGEDREAQLESLVELVDILDAKLSSGATHTAASNALLRARRTVSNVRAMQTTEQRETGTSTNVANSHNAADGHLANGTGRDSVAPVEDSTLPGQAKSSPDGGTLSLNEALSLAASTKLELEEARRELDAMQQRVLSLEKSAERGLRYNEVVEQNTVLQTQLATAKKTITRIIQDTHGSRKFSYGANGAMQSAGSTPEVGRKSGGRGDPDAVQRILKWRQTASSEASTSNANGDPSCSQKAESEGKRVVEKANSHEEEDEGDFDEAEKAPVSFARSKPTGSVSCRRASGVAERKPSDSDVNPASGPSQISQVENCGDEIEVEREISLDADTRNGAEDNISKTESANESAVESFDLGSNDVGSSASAPVRGFLRLGTGSAMSLSGDEITFMGRHNIFGGRARQTDGLRGLLG